MSDVTTNPADPRLTHGSDENAVKQADAYLVLSEDERAKGFVRPYRESYKHRNCPGKRHRESVTTMSKEIAETYARDPKFYGGTYCCVCERHRPLAEFEWLDGESMGS